MYNTKKEYLSTEHKPTVLPELKNLLSPLTDEQHTALLDDILQNGCYSPLVVNQDMILIDGHHRLRLCHEYGIPYRMLVFSFEDLLEAKQWMISTQRGRRNVSSWELGKIALKLKPEVEAKARLNHLANGGDKVSETAKATLPSPVSKVQTRKELADAVGLGERTMGKIIQIDKFAPPAVREALDKKEISVNQGYNITKMVQQLEPDEQAQAAMDSIQKKLNQVRQRIRDEADRRRARIAKAFRSSFECPELLSASSEDISFWIEDARMTDEEKNRYAEDAERLSRIYASVAEVVRNEIVSEERRCSSNA